jgi:hypothetical protein
MEIVMAIHGQPVPPRTLAAWLAWQRQCRAEGKFTEWAEVTRLSWSDAQEWLGEGPTQHWYGDHPFKGHAFCWRCLALAQGLAAHPGIPHAETAICWQTGRHPGTKDPVENSRSPRVRVETDEGRVVIEGSALYITKISPEGIPLGPRERIVGPGFEAEAVDTGTFFWPPYWEPTEESKAATRRFAEKLGLPMEPVQTDEPERTAQPDPESVQADYRDTWPPSWTDDAEPGASAGDTWYNSPDA